MEPHVVIRNTCKLHIDCTNYFPFVLIIIQILHMQNFIIQHEDKNQCKNTRDWLNLVFQPCCWNNRAFLNPSRLKQKFHPKYQPMFYSWCNVAFWKVPECGDYVRHIIAGKVLTLTDGCFERRQFISTKKIWTEQKKHLTARTQTDEQKFTTTICIYITLLEQKTIPQRYHRDITINRCCTNKRYWKC